MQKVSSYNLFGQDPSFQENKRKSIDELMANPDVQRVLKDCSLTRSDVENNWVEFLDFQDDHRACVNCKSFDNCSKPSKGMIRNIVLDDAGEIAWQMQPCKYGQTHFDNQYVLNSIILKNVSNKILLTKTSDLTILDDKNSNASEILRIMMAYVKNPGKKGYYLYGKGGTGKSTIMGHLTRRLALKGYKCGFVHFPTFLMDLKASFSDGGNNSIELMKTLDILVLDDVGGENVTPWSRDEILSSIIAYRMQQEKPTFFTSEYSLTELKKIYNLNARQSQADYRGERLISKMKAVSYQMELKGKDLR